MSDPLGDYVRQQLSYGYTPDQIKAFLLQSGYNEQLVEYKLNEIRPRLSSHRFSLELGVIALLLIVLVGVTSYVLPQFITLQKNPNLLLDLSVDPVKLEVEAGQELIFIKNIDSLGTNKRYDVKLTHTITRIGSREVIASKTETVAVETRVSTQTRMMIADSLAPGDYLLETRAEYDDKRADASFLFMVTTGESTSNPTQNPPATDGYVSLNDLPDPVETCRDNVKNQNEEGIDCGGVCRPCALASCTDGLRNQDETGVDCGGSCGPCIRTSSTLAAEAYVKEAMSMAKSDPHSALIHCDLLPMRKTRDECKMVVVSVVGNYQLCRDIETISLKDSCYLQFSSRTDHAVCMLISNIHLKNSCYSLT